MTCIMTGQLPELLAPCGSPEALDAAIAAGADAVYLGASAFNARMMAKNFSDDDLKNALAKCRYFGVKTNITLNTLIHDRETDELLRTVEKLYRDGADALIVADLGAASLIKRCFPDFELHASTQVAGHNTDAARELEKLGFSRMVAARELSFADLQTLCLDSPIETELFIHGAICVSQSGGCLASSLIGGRSGNRGECAQPCRLPYAAGCAECAGNKREGYPLSLKDNCLALHIPEILSLGAASLKIEGRMKSPAYVYGVTSIYRRLLDEKRSASPEEYDELKALFSRSGFTDGYFTKKVDHSMLGVRTDADKADTRLTEKENYLRLLEDRRRPIAMNVSIREKEPVRLTVSCGEKQISVIGQLPEPAEARPLTEEIVREKLTRLGGTAYIADTCNISLGENLLVPLSALNQLRRDALEKLSQAFFPHRENKLPEKISLSDFTPPKALTTARFLDKRGLPEDLSPYEIVYLPLEKFTEDVKDRVNGVLLPPVIFDSEREAIKEMLTEAKKVGVSHALVSNIGHLSLVREVGLIPHGDFRLNIYNRETAAVLCSLGFEDLMASPELTLPQLRDLGLPPPLYGRIPLMVLEKCVIRDLYSCEACEKNNGTKPMLSLRDRKGVLFPLARTFSHRNILYNSVPLYMGDRHEELIKYRIKGGHFLFTDESPREAAAVSEAYRLGKSVNYPVRRIGK